MHCQIIIAEFCKQFQHSTVGSLAWKPRAELWNGYAIPSGKEVPVMLIIITSGCQEGNYCYKLPLEAHHRTVGAADRIAASFVPTVIRVHCGKQRGWCAGIRMTKAPIVFLYIFFFVFFVLFFSRFCLLCQLSLFN